MRRLSGISRRLLFAFTALVVLFAAASFITLAGLSELHTLAHDVKRKEGRTRALLELASASRDLQVRLGAAIILSDVYRFDAYDQALAHHTRLLAVLASMPNTPEERATLSELGAMSAKLDHLVREDMVASITANDSPRTKQAYVAAAEVIVDAQRRIEQLVSTTERALDRFDDHAGVVQHSSFRWTLGALASSIVIAIVVGIYISRSIARPIARLSAGAARLAGGDLTTRIEVRGSDEFARLAGQFNRMTLALGDHQRRLIESEKLAGIGRLAAGVAHEINNPLAVVLGYVRVLRRSSADARLAQDLQIIEEEAVRCQEVVESLLDLARPPKLKREKNALRAISEEVAARLQHAGLMAGVELTIEGDTDVEGSGSGLRQIFMNLLKNAAEAAGVSGSVGVRIVASGSEAIVSVTDSGPGLDESNRGRLFEPFFTTKPTGTGLGLAISRSVARAHGGDLIVDTSAPVTTFTLRLPVRREEAA